MRIHLIKRQTLENFKIVHARSKTSLDDWFAKLQYSKWRMPRDIIQTYNSADLLGNGSNRVVFDIAGNNYRMICKYAFGNQQIHLFICWMGTHAEYEKLCKTGQQFSINI